MYLLGHKDPKFTMAVYQQVLDVSADTERDLEQLLGCTPEDAFRCLECGCERSAGRHVSIGWILGAEIKTHSALRQLRASDFDFYRRVVFGILVDEHET